MMRQTSVEALTLFLSCEFFYPAVSVDFYNRGDCFKNLIGIECEHNERFGPAEPERTEERQRQNYAPYCDNIEL